MANPQYHLRVYPDKSTKSRDRKSCMDLVVQGDRSLPLNLMVVWSQGQRITE
ncbi:hypothetical protein PHLCEN_2v11408 [Hermanssonia centrifuga]|uniref:Uncharacterized protein n=1 Tax=Hermanssonia centrifuga TaxID=98765 RepID=A0A2R6NK26_9APHY|nr:hypothetical protein PHLCEN_2v11408 [Hermanssonia centrifuga]